MSREFPMPAVFHWFDVVLLLWCGMLIGALAVFLLTGNAENISAFVKSNGLRIAILIAGFFLGAFAVFLFGSSSMGGIQGWASAGAAIGTVASTSLALYFSHRANRREDAKLDADRKDKSERAARYALLIDHELAVLYGQMEQRAIATRVVGANAQDLAYAIQVSVVGHQIVGLPVLEKLVDRLDVFPTEAAIKLGMVLTGVLQLQKNPPPDDPRIPLHVAAQIVGAVHDESVVLAVKALEARQVLRPILAPHVTVRNPLPTLPQVIADRARELHR
jgi:hypothetical protein